MKFAATKNSLTTKFFSPLSFVAVFGSEIRDPGWVKNQDPGLTSRIRNIGINDTSGKFFTGTASVADTDRWQFSKAVNDTRWQICGVCKNQIEKKHKLEG